MNKSALASEFFYIQGTMAADAPSYVPRPADDDLYQNLTAGVMCYVLTSRQMGKSSLMIRTANRLEKEGVQTATVDLNSIGTRLTPEQWHLDVALSIHTELGLNSDLRQWWQAHADQGPVSRFSNYLRDVVLQETSASVVVFIDEIDTTLNLEFSDDFFAVIRSIHNARAREAIYKRLTFCLIGAATPIDLIQDEKRTPFNVGHPVELQDFSPQSARVLQSGLDAIYPGQGERIFERIYHWTSGHPYLTQKLCIAVAEDSNSEWLAADIDALTQRIFFQEERQKKEEHLKILQQYIGAHSRKRELIKLYREIYRGKLIKDDPRNALHNQLKLIGLVRVEDDTLKLRNRVYETVFNEEWITFNLRTEKQSRLLLAAASSLATVLLVLGFIAAAPVLGIPLPWQKDALTVQAQTLEDGFSSTNSADARVVNLAELQDLGFEERALNLFYKRISDEQQIALIEDVNIQAVGESKVQSVFEMIYTSPDASPEVRLAILARLYSEPDQQTLAKKLMFDELSLSEQVEMFRQADPGKAGGHILTVLRAIGRTASADVRLVALASLLQNETFNPQAKALFLKELSAEDQIALFQNVDPGSVGAEAMAAIELIYVELPDTEHNNKLLEVFASTLEQLGEAGADRLAAALSAWAAGREAHRVYDLQAALDALDQVITFNNNNAEAYFDRALIYIDLENFSPALEDLEQTLKLNVDLILRIRRSIFSNPLLSSVFNGQRADYPELDRLSPSIIMNTTVIAQALEEGRQTFISLDMYNDQGVVVCSDSSSLYYGQSVAKSVAADIPGCPAGNMSGVISSDGPLTALLLQSNSMQSSGGTNLKYCTTEGIGTGMSGIYFPDVEIGPDTLDIANLSIQNAGSAPANAEVFFINRDGTVLAQREIQIPVGASKIMSIVSIQETLADPLGWSGSVKVVSQDSSLAGVSTSCQLLDCFSYSALGSGGERWIVPGVVRESTAEGVPGGLSTRIYIQNLDAENRARVNLQFQGTDIRETYALQPQGSVEISSAEFADLLSLSTAEITSSTPVVVSARYMNVGDVQGAAYSGLNAEAGGLTLFMPDLVWKRDQNTDTIIYLQNLSGEEVNPKVFFYQRAVAGEAAPAPFEYTATIPPYGTQSIWVSELFTEIDITEWEGSAVVQVDQAMGGVVLTRTNGDEQWATAYNAWANP